MKYELSIKPAATGSANLDTAPPTQTQAEEHLPEEQVVELSDSDSVPDLNEPPGSRRAGKRPAASPRRSDRIRMMQDGPRVSSVDRAAQRKASASGDQEPSVATYSRRKKAKKLLDINCLAPIPVVNYPPELSDQRLRELASCCGITTIDMIDNALKTNDARDGSSERTVSNG